jgi:acetyl esterase/lipase
MGEMNMHKLRTCRGAAFVSLVCALLAGAAFAQGSVPPPAQALAELRADVQARADHQAYPIAGIDAGDVRQVLAGLKSIDHEEWAAAWSVMGERHATAARAASDGVQIKENWHQAWLDFHFGAWPAQNAPGKRADYKKAVEAFREYGKLLDPPVETVRIPFEGKEIVGYLQLPHGVARAPVVVSIGGLDEFKEYSVEHGSAALTGAGLGSLALDMPGTGEAAVPMEVGSERMIGAVITYLGTRTDVDPLRIAVMGTSAGGYWSATAGYTERQRLRAVVVRGGPIDGYFQADWQRKSWGTSEYLFGLKEARMFVYGFKDGEDDAFLKKLATFSLDTRGILKERSAPMLVVNGEKDSQVPIADLYLLLRTGTPKFAWVNPEGGHTGRSKDFPEDRITAQVVVPWLVSMLGPGTPSH